VRRPSANLDRANSQRYPKNKVGGGAMKRKTPFLKFEIFVILINVV